MKRGSILAVFWCLTACGSRSADSVSAASGPVTQLKELGVLRDPDGISFSANPDYAAIAHDGSVAFADNENQQVVLFDSTGKRAYALGRKGQGPGEFQSIEAVFPLTEDSLAVFDRRRQAMSFVVHSELSTVTLAFHPWELDQHSTLQIIGRFKNGEWVALRSAPRDFFADGVRSVVDTPVVMVGYPSSRPRELFRLPPRRMVDIMSARTSYRVSLTDLSPAVGAVCESGVVLVDTSGVRYLGPRGDTIASFDLPVSRLPLERLGGGREGMVERALYQVRDSPHKERVRKLLDGWASEVDSLMDRPLLDADGNSWWATFNKGGNVYLRVDHHGSVTGRFGASHGPIMIGRQTFMSMGIDSTTESLAFRVYRLPRSGNVPASSIGWCSSPFRY